MSSTDATISNAALNEEIEAVNAIYGTEVLAPVTDSNSKVDLTDQIVLRPPGDSTSFLLSFQHDYPQSRPQVDGSHSTGTLGKGEGHHAVQLIKHTLSKVWTPGSVCLFDLVEEIAPVLHNGTIESSNQAPTHKSTVVYPPVAEAEAELTSRDAEPIHHAHSGHSIPQWIISDPATEKKSVFIARCASVTDKDEATSFVVHLLSTNKKVAAATHNIMAWRIRNTDSGVTVQDYDDDGETAAGGRLLHLMQLMEVWNVMVVVTRWYGGVQLGPDRFRIINKTAREALVKAGFGKGRP